jgi:hypothetical protein
MRSKEFDLLLSSNEKQTKRISYTKTTTIEYFQGLKIGNADDQLRISIIAKCDLTTSLHQGCLYYREKTDTFIINSRRAMYATMVYIRVSNASG